MSMTCSAHAHYYLCTSLSGPSASENSQSVSLCCCKCVLVVIHMVQTCWIKSWWLRLKRFRFCFFWDNLTDMSDLACGDGEIVSVMLMLILLLCRKPLGGQGGSFAVSLIYLWGDGCWGGVRMCWLDGDRSCGIAAKTLSQCLSLSLALVSGPYLIKVENGKVFFNMNN